MSNRADGLRALMKAHNLKPKQVAAMLGRSYQTVRIWLTKDTPRPIPVEVLEDLRNKVAE